MKKKFIPLVWYSLAKNSPPQNEQLIFWIVDKEEFPKEGGYAICGMVINGKILNLEDSEYELIGQTHFMILPESLLDAPHNTYAR